MSTVGLLDLRHLMDCAADVAAAERIATPAPADPTDYDVLVRRLTDVRDALPAVYASRVYRPFFDWLVSSGGARFHKILADDAKRDGRAGVILDIAQAILQRSERQSLVRPMAAFQEILSDLYRGLVDSKDRGRAPAENPEILAPLVRWGDPEIGAYTVSREETGDFGVDAAILSLPPAHASQALAGWAALGHETAGHDLLGATPALLAEARASILGVLERSGAADWLARYWADRVEQASSDVLGMLNMGPAAALGIISYLRGINQYDGAGARLSAEGSLADEHVADILRGHLAAATVALLDFSDAETWAATLRAETLKDSRRAYAGNHELTTVRAERSAQIVAEALVSTRLKSLGGRRLSDLRDWRDLDEQRVRHLRGMLRRTASLPSLVAPGYSAAHAVAAAMYEVVFEEVDFSLIQQRMVGILAMLHAQNPAWKTRPEPGADPDSGSAARQLPGTKRKVVRRKR